MTFLSAPKFNVIEATTMCVAILFLADNNWLGWLAANVIGLGASLWLRMRADEVAA
jgi:hypothetical protein